MELLEAEIVLFAKFQERLKWDKKELIDAIQKLIDQRDDDLEELRLAMLRDPKHGDDDESSQSEEEEDVPLYVEKEESLLNDQLEWLDHQEDHTDENEALEHAAGEVEKEGKEKSKEFTESDFEEGEVKEKEKKKANGHHDAHHGAHGHHSYGNESSGYFLDDGEDQPYTKMERLREPPELDINDTIPGQ